MRFLMILLLGLGLVAGCAQKSDEEKAKEAAKEAKEKAEEKAKDVLP